MAIGFDNRDHGLPYCRGIGFVLHKIANDGGGVVAGNTKEPRVTSNVGSRHGSPYVDSESMEGRRRIPVPDGLHVDVADL
jgi:hypothetical protein